MNARRPLCLRLVLGVVLSATLSFVQSAWAEDGSPYTFGVVPQFEPRKLAEIWTPILEDIERRSGVALVMVGAPGIPEFETAFQDGRYDFAYMNPYHFLMAHQAQGYLPLVRDGSRSLTGILVVRRDNPAQSVRDLDGATIAFPAPNALGASLLMRAELTTLEGLSFTPRYVQTHSSVYLSVMLGQAAAGGGVMGTLKRQPAEIRDGLRVLYTTRPVHPHPIAAHPRVPEDIRARVKAAFLAMDGTETGHALLARVPIGAMTEARTEDYTLLKDWALERFRVD